MDKPEEVKRYHDYGASTGCVPCADGDWVKYSDYQALESKLKEACLDYQVKRDNLKEQVSDLESQLASARKEIEHLDKRCEAWAESSYKFEKELGTANAKIVELEGNLDKTICVWCGHIGKKNALELLNHVKECSKHPMNKSMILIEALEAELSTANKEIFTLNQRIASMGSLVPEHLFLDVQCRLETANKKAEKLVEALAKYGSHKCDGVFTCDKIKFVARHDCNCGLKQAINEFRGEK